MISVMDGSLLPCSQNPMQSQVVPIASANVFWVMPSSFRNSFNLSWNVIYAIVGKLPWEHCVQCNKKALVECFWFLVVSSSDEVVNRYAEEDAQFNQSVVVRLISAHFPARYGGFWHLEMLRKVLLEHVFLLTQRFQSFGEATVQHFSVLYLVYIYNNTQFVLMSIVVCVFAVK